MKQVTIRRCPDSGPLREDAADLKDALRGNPGLRVDVTDGNRGEFTISVDGRVVVRNTDLSHLSTFQLAAFIKEEAFAGTAA